MSAYWVAHVNVKNSLKFNEYMQKVPKVIEHYQGKILVCGDQCENLEGPHYKQHVIIKFENMEKAKKCYFSVDYQELKSMREDAADVIVMLLNDLD